MTRGIRIASFIALLGLAAIGYVLVAERPSDIPYVLKSENENKELYNCDIASDPEKLFQCTSLLCENAALDALKAQDMIGEFEFRRGSIEGSDDIEIVGTLTYQSAGNSKQTSEFICSFNGVKMLSSNFSAENAT